MQPVLKTSRAKRDAQLAVINSGLAAYHVGLFPKLLGRLGKLVLQQERVHAFEKITRHRAFLRHLQHAGKEMNAAVAGKRTCMRRMTLFFSVRKSLLRTSTVFFKMKYTCSSNISWSYVANIYWNSLTFADCFCWKANTIPRHITFDHEYLIKELNNYYLNLIFWNKTFFFVKHSLWTFNSCVRRGRIINTSSPETFHTSCHNTVVALSHRAMTQA